MLEKYQNVLSRFKEANWAVKSRQPGTEFPPEIKNRYSWIPTEIQTVIMEIELVASPDEKAWLLGIRDFLGLSSSAYKWNEWETVSLNAAEGDSKWIAAINHFWDEHFPIALSVKNGYAYFAVRKSDLSVVCGEEPEFEETTHIAPSFLEFLSLLPRPDSNLSRWV